MHPCLPKGSRVAATAATYVSPSDVRRGDVVLFKTDIQGEPTRVVWRVIGLPKDDVAVDGMAVSVNGEFLDRLWMGKTDEWTYFLESADGERYYCVGYHREDRSGRVAEWAITVPSDHFVVLGDNRDSSYDSRFIGTVPFTSIIAEIDDPTCPCPTPGAAL